MTSKKIVIAGGTGFIGEYLIHHFQRLDYKVLIISRQSGISWNNEEEIIYALENAELLINLAGKSVNCRYNEENKKEILSSRTETTKALGRAVSKCKLPPKLWINSSTATIYRHAVDRPMTEADGEIGTGFSVNVATQWEKAFFDFELPHTRQVALRMAIVLGRGGGVIQPLHNLVCLGLGGKQGTGNQMFSWIHIEDLLQIILFLQNNAALQGVFNCASPEPIDNARLMKSFRHQLNKSFGLPTPTWMLKIGAVLLGTETELVLKSRWVLPQRLVDAGYQFRFPNLEKALADILIRK